MEAGAAMPVAVALLSPWSDLTHEGDSHRGNDGRDPTLTLHLARQAALLYSGGRDLAHPDLSPLRGAWREPLPPVMITTGTRDLLLDQNMTLAAVLENAGADVTLRVWDDLWHVFEFYDELPEADRSLRDIAAFLRRHLNGS